MQKDGPGTSRERDPERLTWSRSPVPPPAAKDGAEPSAVVAVAVSEPAPSGAEARLGGAFVDAFDRLSDRLLERLRSLRLDIDADLGAVRAELAGLRQAVDAVADRVQSRQVRSTLEEVHGEVIALRSAVLEWPELEQISLDLTAIRGDLAFLFERRGGGPGQAPSELLGELQHLVANLAGEVRRLSTPAAPVRLDEEQLDRLVEAVAARVVDRQAAEADRRAAEQAEQDDAGGRRGRRR